MINFFDEEVSVEIDRSKTKQWITAVIKSESKKEGEINFIFCDDEYLLDMNQKYLNHDTYTDVISFDRSLGNELHGDIYISSDRVLANSIQFKVIYEEELRRVIIHGVLHLCGYKDKREEDSRIMKNKEDEKLLMFHVEH